MIDPETHTRIKQEITERIFDDNGVLDELGNEIKSLRSDVRRIQARSATSISLVGTDGGNNYLQFDPFHIHTISSNIEYCQKQVGPFQYTVIIFSTFVSP